MATILAAANGNWSATGTWIGGIIPTTGDIVVANNRTVTINTNVACIEVRNDTTGGATAGGGYTLNNNVIFSGNIINNGANGTIMSYTSTLGNSSTVVGNLIGLTNTSTNPVFSAAGAGTLNFFGNISGVFANTGGQIFFLSNIANLNIVGSCINNNAGSSKSISLGNNSSNLTFVGGNIIGGVGGVNASATAISIDAPMSSINISGNIIGGSTSINFQAGCKAIAIASSTTNINIFGNIFGGPISPANLVQNNNVGLSIEALCGSINISGSVYGGGGSLTPAISNITATPVNVNGTVLGGAGNSAFGIQNTSNGIITINGDVVGGLSAIGISNQGIGSVIINGTAIGGSGAVGVFNNSTGSVTCTLAKGNAYGIGSSGLTPQVGLWNNVAGNCYVSGIEFGDRGMSPVVGPVQFINSTGNFCSMFRPSGLSKKILVDPLVSGSLLPSSSDVRKNTVYGLGNLVGSLSMPPSETVSYGVLTDNTSGTAILNNPNQIWDYPVSNITGVNSIGNRLKNCSTVENLGQQLANILSSMNS